jgi:hypothetical protein
MGKETMKIILLAGAAALSLNMGIAYAGEGDVPPTNMPSVPTSTVPSTVQNGQTTQAFVTQSDRGTWFNQPSYEGANN